jgi:hypothetical protein
MPSSFPCAAAEKNGRLEPEACDIAVAGGKDCHAGIGMLAKYGRCTRPSVVGFFYSRQGEPKGARRILSRWCPLFFTDGDYQAFMRALAHACVEIPSAYLPGA